MNKIVLIGNLTKDPETRTIPSGATVCSFTIAVNRRFSDSNGEKVTDFFKINAWRQLGEVCSRYLAKGRKVAVIGELQARQYDGKNGTQMSLDVAADEVEFLTPREDTAKQIVKTVTDNTVKKSDDIFSDIHDEDLPF